MSVGISFSQDSGFYSEQFMLTITGNPKYTLRYTLDGSTPDNTSSIYEEPILIEDASLYNNVYSARTDTSAGFAYDSGYAGCKSGNNTNGIYNSVRMSYYFPSALFKAYIKI